VQKSAEKMSDMCNRFGAASSLSIVHLKLVTNAQVFWILPLVHLWRIGVVRLHIFYLCFFIFNFFLIAAFGNSDRFEIVDKELYIRRRQLLSGLPREKHMFCAWLYADRISNLHANWLNAQMVNGNYLNERKDLKKLFTGSGFIR
jgi:hypothetical protein